MAQDRVVQFVRLIQQTRAPVRADRSGAGSLPGRAMRYCDALTSATGYGYWVFCPMDIALLWDGEQIFWSHDDARGWLPLSNTRSGAIQFPGHAAEFDAVAPPELRGCSPPFLTALPEVGGVQVWTGLLAKTCPGWSLAVRLPVNLPPTPGLAAWEGIIEADLRFGPLFTNLRLTRTNQLVRLRAGVPLLQVQPLPQLAYRDETLAAMSCSSPADMSSDDWHRFGRTVTPDTATTSRQGDYAVEVRKRRRCPHHAQVVTKLTS